MPRPLMLPILVLTLGSCAAGWAGAAQTPTASARQRAEYPPHRYITGTGRAATVEAARQRAMAAIASQIQGSLWAQEAVVAEEIRGTDGGRHHSRDEESIREEIRIETRLPRTEWVRVVSAIEVDGGHEVVAILDRREAADTLRSEIDRASAALARGIASARSAPGLLARSRAVEALRPERQELLASHLLIGAIAREPVPFPAILAEFDELEGALRAAWAEVSWEICLVGEQAAQRATALAARLAGHGLDALPCPGGDLRASDRRLRIQGTLNVRTQTVHQAGAYPVFCSTHLEFRVIDDEGGIQGGGGATGVRAGGMGPGEACATSLEDLAGALLDSLGHPERRARPRAAAWR